MEYGAIDGASGGALHVPDADKAEISEFLKEDGVFWYRGRVEEVTVPADVTEIGEKAFASWDGLCRVTVPEGVTKIGDFAFQNCDEGLTVHAPENSIRFAPL